MKKISIVFLFLILAIITYLFSNKKTNQNFSGYKIINHQLENRNLRLLVADNQQKWEKGLMGVKKLEKGIDGMIFIFPKKDGQSFWNKNTLMDLDLYWLAGDKIVGRDFLPAIKENKETIMVSSPQQVDKVIEIPTN